MIAYRHHSGLLATLIASLLSAAPIGEACSQTLTDTHGVVTVVATLDGTRVSTGTGFYVSPQVVLTAYHVISKAKRVEIRIERRPGGVPETADVKILHIDPSQDLAALWSDTAYGQRTLNRTIPTVDDDLKLMGSAAGIPGSTTPVRLSHGRLLKATELKKELPSGQQTPIYPATASVDVLRFSGVVYGGVSGGPILRSDGTVVGLALGSNNIGGTFGWAIPSSSLQTFVAAAMTQRFLAYPRDYSWPPLIFEPMRDIRLGYFLRRSGASDELSIADEHLALRLAEANRFISRTVFRTRSSLESIADAISIRSDFNTNRAKQRPFEADTRADWDELRPVIVGLVEALETRQTLPSILPRVLQHVRILVRGAEIDQGTSRRISLRLASAVGPSDVRVVADRQPFELAKGINIEALTKALSEIGQNVDLVFGDAKQRGLFIAQCRNIRETLRLYSEGDFMVNSLAEARLQLVLIELFREYELLFAYSREG